MTTTKEYPTTVATLDRETRAEVLGLVALVDESDLRFERFSELLRANGWRQVEPLPVVEDVWARNGGIVTFWSTPLLRGKITDCLYTTTDGSTFFTLVKAGVCISGKGLADQDITYIRQLQAKETAFFEQLSEREKTVFKVLRDELLPVEDVSLDMSIDSLDEAEQVEVQMGIEDALGVEFEGDLSFEEQGISTLADLFRVLKEQKIL